MMHWRLLHWCLPPLLPGLPRQHLLARRLRVRQFDAPGRPESAVAVRACSLVRGRPARRCAVLRPGGPPRPGEARIALQVSPLTCVWSRCVCPLLRLSIIRGLTDATTEAELFGVAPPVVVVSPVLPRPCCSLPAAGPLLQVPRGTRCSGSLFSWRFRDHGRARAGPPSGGSNSSLRASLSHQRSLSHPRLGPVPSKPGRAVDKAFHEFRSTHLFGPNSLLPRLSRGVLLRGSLFAAVVCRWSPAFAGRWSYKLAGRRARARWLCGRPGSASTTPVITFRSQTGPRG